MQDQVGMPVYEAITVNSSECCVARNQRLVWYGLKVIVQFTLELINSPTCEVPHILGK